MSASSSSPKNAGQSPLESSSRTLGMKGSEAAAVAEEKMRMREFEARTKARREKFDNLNKNRLVTPRVYLFENATNSPFHAYGHIAIDYSTENLFCEYLLGEIEREEKKMLERRERLTHTFSSNSDSDDGTPPTSPLLSRTMPASPSTTPRAVSSLAYSLSSSPSDNGNLVPKKEEEKKEKRRETFLLSYGAKQDYISTNVSTLRGETRIYGAPPKIIDLPPLKYSDVRAAEIAFSERDRSQYSLLIVNKENKGNCANAALDYLDDLYRGMVGQIGVVNGVLDGVTPTRLFREAHRIKLRIQLKQHEEKRKLLLENFVRAGESKELQDLIDHEIERLELIIDLARRKNKKTAKGQAKEVQKRLGKFNREIKSTSDLPTHFKLLCSVVTEIPTSTHFHDCVSRFPALVADMKVSTSDRLHDCIDRFPVFKVTGDLSEEKEKITINLCNKQRILLRLLDQSIRQHDRLREEAKEAKSELLPEATKTIMRVKQQLALHRSAIYRNGGVTRDEAKILGELHADFSKSFKEKGDRPDTRMHYSYWLRVFAREFNNVGNAEKSLVHQNLKEPWRPVLDDIETQRNRMLIADIQDLKQVKQYINLEIKRLEITGPLTVIAKLEKYSSVTDRNNHRECYDALCALVDELNILDNVTSNHLSDCLHKFPIPQDLLLKDQIERRRCNEMRVILRSISTSLSSIPSTTTTASLHKLLKDDAIQSVSSEKFKRDNAQEDIVSTVCMERVNVIAQEAARLFKGKLDRLKSFKTDKQPDQNDSKQKYAEWLNFWNKTLESTMRQDPSNQNPNQRVSTAAVSFAVSITKQSRV